MIASKTRWRAAEAASPRRRFARALDLRSEAPCGNIPAPPAVTAVMSVPFLFRLAANAAFWRGRAGDPVGSYYATMLPATLRSEVEVDRDLDPYGDRLVVAQGRLEHPLLHSLDRGVVQPRHAPHHLDVLDPTVLAHQHVEDHLALDLRFPRELRVGGRRRGDGSRRVLVVDELALRGQVVDRDVDRVLPRP